jgi:hypothetical protein
MDAAEIGFIKSSLKQAKAAHMLWEFKEWYRSYRQQGETIYKSCYYALTDWDI